MSISFTIPASLCARSRFSKSLLASYWMPMSNALLTGARVTSCNPPHFEGVLLVGKLNGDQLLASVAKMPVLRVGAGRGERLLPSKVELLGACGAMNVDRWSAQSTLLSFALGSMSVVINKAGRVRCQESIDVRTCPEHVRQPCRSILYAMRV